MSLLSSSELTPIYSRFPRKDQPSTRLWECHRGGLDFGQIRLEAIKQASKQRGQQPKCQEEQSCAAANRDADLRSRSWREGGISCHVHFPQRSRRWPMSPHSDLPHTQQVLASRLSLACCESNSSGRHCLIRMCTDSSYPIPVFQGSQVLPLICRPVNQGLI